MEIISVLSIVQVLIFLLIVNLYYYKLNFSTFHSIAIVLLLSLKVNVHI